eukprot:TRINITY_DN41840_c0_g1_i1.p1 TRINITY_DN41840_c0_g1~~TRINITY_DN41840_c0_g1_i1.p1  ORF type:complete len:122 (+),score=14.67 TRINITY_DN41840_c0_g1_i1:233-598(+)
MVCGCLRVFAVGFDFVFLPNFGEGEFMKTNGSKFLIFMAWMYVVLTEYVMGFDHLESPACAGIVFQHLPTYVVLLVAGIIRSTVRGSCLGAAFSGYLVAIGRLRHPLWITPLRCLGEDELD